MLKEVKHYKNPFDDFLHSYITIDEIEHYDPEVTVDAEGKRTYKSGEWLDRDESSDQTRFTCIHPHCNHPTQGHPVFDSVQDMETHIWEHLKDGDD